MAVERTSVLTPEAARAAAAYLEDAHECISNDDLAEAYLRAAQFLRLVDAPVAVQGYGAEADKSP